MTLDRRTALTWMAMFAAWPGVAGLKGRPEAAQNAKPLVPNTRVRRIATEEAFTIPEMIEPVHDALRRGGPSLDLALLALIYQAPSGPAPPSRSTGAASVSRDALARLLLPQLLDLDAGRLAEMDANGVDMQLLSLSMPGVQIFERDQAIVLARLANDRLSDARSIAFRGSASSSAHGGGIAVLDVAPRFHGGAGCARRRAQEPAETERVLSAQFRDHDQRG